MRKLHNEKTIYDYRTINIVSPLTQIFPNVNNAGKAIYDNNGVLVAFTDKDFPDIIYNKPYASTNKYCAGEHFIVLDKFKSKKTYSNGKKSIILKIIFVETRTTLTISYTKFKSLDIYDPYFRNKFDNKCCIGNIIIPDDNNSFVFKIYALWCEIMRRCFDHTYFTYKLFGGSGWMPFYSDWVCFELFYCYMIKIRDDYRTDSDFFSNIGSPNDIKFYSYYGNCSEKDISCLSKVPYEHLINTTRLSVAIQQFPLNQRSDNFYYPEISPGRISGSKVGNGYNKSKENKKMYRLVNRGWHE